MDSAMRGEIKMDDISKRKERKMELFDDVDNCWYKEIPDEDLWQDGELSRAEVKESIIYHVVDEGDWVLMRRKDNYEVNK